jgi:nucleotide-binding universal stress UspA family protein
LLRGAWVVGVDFSDASNGAVRAAQALAAKGAGRLVIVHVMEDADDRRAAPGRSRGATNAARIAAQLRLDTIADDVRRATAGGRPGGEAVTVELRIAEGNVADELTRIARDVDAAGLVIGSRGRSGIAHLLLGTAAERCLRRADRPVVVAPRSPFASVSPPSEASTDPTD